MWSRFFQREPERLSLTLKSGEIYAHVHENALTGLARNLFWNLRIDCEPVSWGGEDWNCSLAIEWLTLPLRRWKELDGMDLGQVLVPDMLETSVYFLDQHHLTTVSYLQLRASSPGHFDVVLSGQAELEEDGHLLKLEFSGTCTVQFDGVIVVPSNLEPKPVTSDEADAVVAAFIELDGLQAPRTEGWRYVLEPDVMRQLD